MDDVDWDDVLPTRASEASEAPGRGAVGGELVAADRALCARRRRVKTSTWKVKLPCPQARTAEQKWLAASRMRDAKSKKQRRTLKTAAKEVLKEALDKLRSLGLLRDGSKTKIRAGDVLSIQVASGPPACLPFEAMQQIAFRSLRRRNDTARTFGVDPATVTTVQVLAAEVKHRIDVTFMEQMGKLFKEAPPRVFVSGMAADATSERLALPVVGLETLREATSSPWHVMVSINRFSWLRADGSDGSPAWEKIDFTRPNVALTSSESGETIWASLYHVDAISAFADVELIGLANATWPFLHFDIDGQAGGVRMTALRRQEVKDACGKYPLVSSRHCGNHVGSLTDCAVLDAHDDGERCFNLVQTGAIFFQMGGNFLRLIQCVRFELDDNMVAPIIGLPPIEATCMSAELSDYFLKNYKGFVATAAGIDDGWSSGSEEDPPEQQRQDRANSRKRNRRNFLYKKAWTDFLAIFNGWIWKTGCAIGPTYIDSLDEVPGLKDRATRALVQLLFRGMPSRPSKKKWTKFGPALDWFIGAVLSSGVPSSLVPTPLQWGT